MQVKLNNKIIEVNKREREMISGSLVGAVRNLNNPDIMIEILQLSKKFIWKEEPAKKDKKDEKKD